MRDGIGKMYQKTLWVDITLQPGAACEDPAAAIPAVPDVSAGTIYCTDSNTYAQTVYE